MHDLLVHEFRKQIKSVFFTVAELALELPKESDIIEAITLLEDNDSSFTEVNLNNHPLIQPEHLDQIMAALKINTYVENVSLANVRMVDKHAAVSCVFLNYLSHFHKKVSNHQLYTPIQTLLSYIQSRL